MRKKKHHASTVWEVLAFLRSQLSNFHAYPHTLMSRRSWFNPGRYKICWQIQMSAESAPTRAFATYKAMCEERRHHYSGGRSRHIIIAKHLSVFGTILLSQSSFSLQTNKGGLIQTWFFGVKGTTFFYGICLASIWAVLGNFCRDCDNLNECQGNVATDAPRYGAGAAESHVF
jgi:hypothetical protein